MTSSIPAIPIEMPQEFIYSLQFYPTCIAPASYNKWSAADKEEYAAEQLLVYRQQAKKIFKWADTLTHMHEDWDTPCGATVGEFAIMHEYLGNQQRRKKQQQNKDEKPILGNKRAREGDEEMIQKKLKSSAAIPSS